MESTKIIVTAWNNGSYHNSGAGYGLSFTKRDRDKYLARKSKILILNINGIGDIRLNLDKASFWKNCPHVISKELGSWLINNGFSTWKRGKPPKFTIQKIGENHYKVIR